MSRLVLAGVVAVLSVVAGGCDESLSDLAGPTPNLSPSFSSIQREIFLSTGTTGCASCHNPNGGAFRQVGVDLSSEASAYSALVGTQSVQRPGMPRVTPGDPDNSYLIHKLEGRSGITGLRMPRNGPPYLTDGQIQIIRRWISNGAARN